MAEVVRTLAACLVLLLCAGPAIAQQSGEAPEKEAREEEGTEESKFEETMVVTASRSEQPLNEAPAAMTVLGSERLEQIPADDAGDYLRNVPGLNVSQISARDVQITGRGATNSLATSQLVLLDNRTLYLDFFGFVMWDFIPLNPDEIKQIEVVRGPGSAVWGANAMSGVVNMITKSPKEMQGTYLTLGGGGFGTRLANVAHAGVHGKLGYKISGGYYEQDPYDRPTGIIPGTIGPLTPEGTPYPPFENGGTEQPKVSFRLDYDQSTDTTWSFSGGYAETDGIMHSGIGPFDIDAGTSLSFFKVDYSRGSARATLFGNLLDGDAVNLLTRGADLMPLNFLFESETYNLDFSDSKLLGDHILTYGATARRNEFDLSIAPAGDARDEFGVFVQGEFHLAEKVRWVVGGRWDDVDPIGSVVSPRTSLLVLPRENHTVRISFNRAFRAPSMVNNFLDTTIFNSATVADPTSPVEPFDVAFASGAVGNVNLEEEELEAVEVGYVGTFGKRTTFTASIYRNETTGSIDFYESASYPADRAMAPPGSPVLLTDAVLPLPPPSPPIVCPAGTLLVDCPIPGLYEAVAPNLPLQFSYRNIGEIVDRGVELSLDIRPADAWSIFLNYSWQDESDVTGIEQEVLLDGTVRDAVNTAPEHRANLGVAFNGERFFANGTVNYQDEAFWTDVLDRRFWGPTESFTLVNARAGVRLSDQISLSVSVQNLLDEDAQNHVFGDLIPRKVTGQLSLRFPK